MLAPDTRRRLVPLLFVVLPLIAWFLMAQDLVYRSTGGREIVQVAKLAPLTLETPRLLGALAAGFLLALVASVALMRVGESAFEGARFKRWLRGSKIVSMKALRAQCEEPGQSQIEVAGLPMPSGVETLHLMINGATGSGKSALLRPLVFSALRRGDRIVAVDPNGDLLSKFLRPGDKVLNPYDARTQGWSFFNEIREDYDWKRFALSMVPRGETAEAEEWNDFGRLLLRETARKLATMGSPSIQELFKWCTIADPKDLRKFLEGTVAESLFAGSSEASKALSSARFVLSNKLSEHVHMPAGRFSLRDWLDDPAGGNLFVTWREDMKDAMKPLLSAWVDVLCTSILSLPESRTRRVWLLIDELASLEKLPSLLDALTKGRKHGLRIVAGLQSTSQLADIYGEKSAQTIRASFRSLVVLGGAKTDPQTADDMSKSLGEHEVERDDYSMGLSARGTSPSLRVQRTVERIVTPSQIAALPELTGYVAFAGNLPIAKIKQPFYEYKSSVKAFERMPGGEDWKQLIANS